MTPASSVRNSVDSDEAMKRGDEAIKTSLLHFFKSVKKGFITSIAMIFTQRLMLHRHYLQGKSSFNA
jgi:hypothetical protein